MGPADLSRVLAPLAARVDPRLVVGHETFDDAGIFVLADDFALVQTVDFFAPIVDDPYAFGQVAAANALSDVYAMGGTPLTALNIVAFPTGKLPLEVLSEILRGGRDKVHEAGAVVVGGHTVTDDELKFGLSVTGRADPRRLLTNAAARAGDVLVLTKPIGSGLLATAIKRADAALAPDAERRLVDTMVALNRLASEVALALGVVAATDVTGFGLGGHASHIAAASDVTLVIEAGRVPVLGDARGAWERGARTGGAERNLAYLQPLVDWGAAGEWERALLTDPQTSGGLLVAVPPGALDEYLSRVPGAVVIGGVEPASTARICVR
jgi:selenide, water dikinase